MRECILSHFFKINGILCACVCVSVYVGGFISPNRTIGFRYDL